MLHHRALAGKVALISGATGAIGGAVSRALGATGVRLVCCGRAQAKAARRREDLVSLGLDPVSVHALEADVSTLAGASAAVEGTLERYGKLDILVNAAGAARFGDLKELAPEEVEETLRATLLSAVYLSQAALEPLTRTKGQVINIASGLSRRPAAGAAAYVAAQHGLRGFTESLRMEMGRYGVRVSLISAAGAGVGTPFWDKAKPELKRQGMMPPERVAEGVLLVLAASPDVLMDDLTIRTR